MPIINLGKILREGRKKQGLSQQNLIDMAGVTKRAIAYWEKGTKSMNAESTDGVSKALRISMKVGEQQFIKLASSRKAGERERRWRREFLSEMERLGPGSRLK